MRQGRGRHGRHGDETDPIFNLFSLLHPWPPPATCTPLALEESSFLVACSHLYSLVVTGRHRSSPGVCSKLSKPRPGASASRITHTRLLNSLIFLIARSDVITLTSSSANRLHTIHATTTIAAYNDLEDSEERSTSTLSTRIRYSTCHPPCDCCHCPPICVPPSQPFSPPLTTLPTVRTHAHLCQTPSRSPFSSLSPPPTRPHHTKTAVYVVPQPQLIVHAHPDPEFNSYPTSDPNPTTPAPDPLPPALR